MFLTKTEKHLKLITRIAERDTKITTEISFSLDHFPLDWGDFELLKSIGWITLDRQPENWTFKFTNEGASYFHVSKVKAQQFLLKSVLAPVLVAFFTTIITLFLKGSL